MSRFLRWVEAEKVNFKVGNEKWRRLLLREMCVASDVSTDSREEDFFSRIRKSDDDGEIRWWFQIKPQHEHPLVVVVHYHRNKTTLGGWWLSPRQTPLWCRYDDDDDGGGERVAGFVLTVEVVVASGGEVR
ncbi:hypothetical protein Tco_0396386 [Tanacetum coccineum]